MAFFWRLQRMKDSLMYAKTPFRPDAARNKSASGLTLTCWKQLLVCIRHFLRFHLIHLRIETINDLTDA